MLNEKNPVLQGEFVALFDCCFVSVCYVLKNDVCLLINGEWVWKRRSRSEWN